MVKPSIHTIQLISKSFSTNQDCCILTYHCPTDFIFQDGQFVQFHINMDGRITKRSYSIMSSYTHFQASSQLQFMIKRVEHGIVSNWIFDHHTIGEWFQIIWPLGHLQLTQQFSEYLFIGTWSWLAPLLSIYNGLGDEVKKSILYGERTSNDLCSHIIHTIGKEHIILSREQHPDYQYGHVQDRLHTLLWMIHNLNDIGVFLCGKPSMVDDVKQQLIGFGIPAHHIKDEKY